MLDDHGYVQNLDQGNALGIIAGQPSQLKQHYDVKLPKLDGIQQIVVAGMGGSALGAEFIRSYLSDRLPVPLIIVRDYKLPSYVGPKTLLFVSSYSGNTEETLSCLEAAKQSGVQIVVCSSGGKLKVEADANGYPYIQFPAGFQPRLAVLFQVRAYAQVFEQQGWTSGIVSELEDAADWVSNQAGTWMLDSPTADNQAKQIAEKLVGNPVVIYGGPTLALPAMKWKIDINENAKNVAFYNSLPEFNHNEFTGWLHPEQKHLSVIELQSSLDHPQISKRFEVSNRLLSGKMPRPIIVNAKGETKLQQMLWTLLLGDFVSAYLAFLNGIDPTPVDMIEKLKKELA